MVSMDNHSLHCASTKHENIIVVVVIICTPFSFFLLFPDPKALLR